MSSAPSLPIFGADPGSGDALVLTRESGERKGTLRLARGRLAAARRAEPAVVPFPPEQALLWSDSHDSPPWPDSPRASWFEPFGARIGEPSLERLYQAALFRAPAMPPSSAPGPALRASAEPDVPAPTNLAASAAADPAPLPADPRELGTGPPWTADQLSAAPSRPFAAPGSLDPPVPTLAPRPWPLPQPVGQRLYDERFEAAYPGTAEALRGLPGVVVAGAAAAWPLGEVGGIPPPAMFCFVGQPINEAALWARLRASVEAVIGGGPGSVGCYLEPGRLRLEADGGQMTFALRPFATAAELLDVFGVPAAAVAYDGRTALMSRRGAHAHAFRVNAVDPARRDGDYEAELRRSFGCGYALAFPALDATSLQPGIPLRLPRLEVLPATVRGQLAAGSFLRPSAVAAPECVRRLCLQIEMVETNIKRLMAPGPPRFAAFGMMARAAVAAWLGDIPTDPSRLISRPALANYLASAADKALAHDRLDLNALCSVFLMDPEEVGRAAAAVARARAADPAASFTIGPTLRHIANTILERFDGLQPASWWVQADPVGEPDEAWYGSHLRRRAPASEEEASPGARRAPSEQREGPALAGGPAGRTSSTDLPVLGPAGAPSPSAPEPARAQPGPADPPASEQVPSAEQKAGPAEYKEMLAYVEGRTRSDADPTCAICSESVTRGAVNSVHLGCGHNYHWGATGGCAGLAKWCRRSDTCPTCRARFDGSPSSAPGSRAVAVTWARPGA